MQNGNPKTEDTNRSTRLQALRILERLLKQATDAEFTGHVILQLNAKDGVILGVKTDISQFHRD